MIGLAVAVGVPAPVVVIALLTWLAPVPAVVAVSVWLLHGLRHAPLRRALSPISGALLSIAGDMRAGATLRQTLMTSPIVGREARRMLAAGRPLEVAAPHVVSQFGSVGPVVAAAIRLAGRTGVATSDLFGELASQVLEMDEVRREIRLASAPVIAQGVVVGGIPALLVVWMIGSGRLAELVATGPVHAVVALAGTLLIVMGIGVTVFLVRRATP